MTHWKPILASSSSALGLPSSIVIIITISVAEIRTSFLYLT